MDDDNRRMTTPSAWYPVLPARSLPVGGVRVTAAQVRGQDIAVWRSTSTAVQAWEDRCPHRGVALSLGRVLGDRLACAYHGWEYAAADGRCVAIPAMPHQPVPGKVCVKAFAAREHQGLVWVALHAGMDAAAPALPAADGPAPHFLRTLSLDMPLAGATTALAALGFAPAGHCQWSGPWSGHGLRLWTLDAAAGWCQLHVATDAAPPADGTAPLFAALRLLRERLQTQPA